MRITLFLFFILVTPFSFAFCDEENGVERLKTSQQGDERNTNFSGDPQDAFVNSVQFDKEGSTDETSKGNPAEINNGCTEQVLEDGGDSYPLMNCKKILQRENGTLPQE